MSFQIGNKVQYKAGIHPQLSSNVYVVIEKVSVNIAKQYIIGVRNIETGEELIKNPEDLEIL